MAFCTAHAQLPTSNIYTMSLRANEQKVLLDDLTYLTSFNPDGYNNQPYFINSNELIITSDFEAMGLTDILLLHLQNKEIQRITRTEESEYSPTLMKSGDTFSVIRQELDDSTPVPQVLWSYPLNREEFGNILIKDLDNIGYHSWITKDKVALFLVDNPSELLIYDVRTATSTHIEQEVGRCLKSDNKGNLYFVAKRNDENVIVKRDVYLGRSTDIIPVMNPQGDFDILPNGHLISGNGSILYSCNPSYSPVWKEVRDLSKAGIGSISRIASVNGKIAFVTTPQ